MTLLGHIILELLHTHFDRCISLTPGTVTPTVTLNCLPKLKFLDRTLSGESVIEKMALAEVGSSIYRLNHVRLYFVSDKEY